MNNFENTRFALTYSKKEIQSLPYYEGFKGQIEDNGSFEWAHGDAGKVKIYTPELALILTTENLPVFNCKTKENVVMKRGELLKVYVEGYKEGEKYFDTEFAVTPDTLHGANRELYVKGLHLHYFHTDHPGAIGGWQHVRKHYPTLFNLKVIENFGYYSGIVSKVEAIIDKFPILFETFDKCEHQTTEKENSLSENKLSEISKSENLFWKGIPMEQVIKHFEVMSKTENKKKEHYLTTEQLISFLKKGFLNDTTQNKQKINLSPGEKGFVISRFYEFYELAVSKYNHPQQKEQFIKLFIDCFDNGEESTVKSYFKPNKTKRKW